uniref:Uncharacterized protein n=1 Tax=Virus NIOZ-UU159 TaxID=2763270 RepID=A0A7S9SUN6_9VIRU|nr:MAG: hypothetical protein NIOZUU159_00057 [Virus NIOZ-UU159]
MKSGAKSVYVNYSGSKINIQTPVMNIPYGVNDNQKFIKDDPKRKDEPPKYDITVSFKGIDENPKIKVFHDKMKELEEKIIDDAFANRLAWFKNNYGGNKDTVSNMFSNIIKHDKDKETGEVVNKYPPTLKAKIPYNPLESKFEFDSYDMDNKEVDFTEYVSNLKGGRAQFIIQLNGIWFSAGMFGCSWKIVSGKFQQSNASKPTFIPDSDDDVEEDEEDEEDIEVDTDAIKAKTEETKEDDVKEEEEEEAEAEAVAAEEEEEEEEEDEEEEPEPPKPVKKAPVKKAAKK